MVAVILLEEGLAIVLEPIVIHVFFKSAFGKRCGRIVLQEHVQNLLIDQ